MNKSCCQYQAPLTRESLRKGCAQQCLGANPVTSRLCSGPKMPRSPHRETLAPWKGRRSTWAIGEYGGLLPGAVAMLCRLGPPGHSHPTLRPEGWRDPAIGGCSPIRIPRARCSGPGEGHRWREGALRVTAGNWHLVQPGLRGHHAGAPKAPGKVGSWGSSLASWCRVDSVWHRQQARPCSPERGTSWFANVAFWFLVSMEFRPTRRGMQAPGSLSLALVISVEYFSALAPGTLGTGSFFVSGAVLCAVGCSAASLVSTH